MFIMDGVRQPVAAGTFYRRESGSLMEEIELLLPRQRKPFARAVVAPHAGYAYSGRTACLAISSLLPARRFIILGPNHTGMGPDFSLFPRGSWRTPLGDAPVDAGLAKELSAAFPELQEDAEAHSQEHSIEVQLPILQSVFQGFSFAPVSIMSRSYSASFLLSLRKLGDAVASVLASHPDASVVASSDFTHYVPVQAARKRDMEAIARIEALDPEGFFGLLGKAGGSVCGYAAITALLFAARRMGWKARLLEYATSGDATADYKSVVGYAAIGFG
jgi:AmmeMemoRadiSam system protein B